MAETTSSDIVEGAFCPLPFPVVRWLMMAGLGGVLTLPALYIVAIAAHFVGLFSVPALLMVVISPLAFIGVYLFFAIRHRNASPRSLRQPSLFSIVGTVVLIPFIWVSGMTLFATALNLLGLDSGVS